MLFPVLPGTGAHEVIIETPVHNLEIPDRGQDETRSMLTAYRSRYRILIGRPDIACVVIIKNRGKRAGASLEHPHSQVVGFPFVPTSVRERSAIASDHLRRTGRCLLCNVLEQEMEDNKRIVRDAGGFVTLVPYAPQLPGEMWIVPYSHPGSFAGSDDAVLVGLADALTDATARLRKCFGDMDYNYAVHSAPSDEQIAPHQHWYVQLSPRTATIAGVELSTGVFINAASPEETAGLLRTL